MNHNKNRTRCVLTLRRLRVRVAEHFVLVTEHVVVDVEFVCNGSLKERKTINQHFLLQVHVTDHMITG